MRAIIVPTQRHDITQMPRYRGSIVAVLAFVKLQSNHSSTVAKEERYVMHSMHWPSNGTEVQAAVQAAVHVFDEYDWYISKKHSLVDIISFDVRTRIEADVYTQYSTWKYVLLQDMVCIILNA
jgi:hypothetical protein